MHRTRRASEEISHLMSSTTDNKALERAVSFCIWILLWAFLSALIDQELFLPSPLRVIYALSSMVGESSFWRSIAFSLSRVSAGIVISFLSAILLSALSYRFRLIDIFLDPALKVIKATPVASIIILVLLWIKSRNLSIVISFLMVFPILYTALLDGLNGIGYDMIEMADVYGIRGLRRIRYIYMPYVMPALRTALRTALAMGWKSAVAAEVIGLPSFSIGSELYQSKVYFDTPRLFAWTAVIVLLAFLFERLFIFIISIAERRIVR